jgi:hypothetical protein
MNKLPKPANKKIILKSADFEKMFGEKLSPYLIKKIKEYNFIYSEISNEERDVCLKKIIDVLLANHIIYAGKHRQKQWEKGWGENLNDLSKKDKLSAIAPHYFGKYDILRINQKFIRPLSPEFERKSLAIILDWLADKYMRETQAIYEFGCGTGHHLIDIRKVNAKANIYGLDWAVSSQKIIKKISKDLPDKKLFAHKFDFFNPDKKFKLEKNSVIYTVAALEQTGNRFEKFLNYLLENKPKLCIHIEPIAELLDEKNLLDYLSIQYFSKRKYLSGYLKRLQSFEKKGKLKIFKAQRSYIGSLFIDGYSIIVWSAK